MCQNSVFAKFGGCQNEVFEKKIAFFCFFVGKIETEKRKKRKWKRPKNPIKIVFFFKVVIQKCEKAKKWIFSKNCLTLFVSGREKKRAFSCTLSVLAKNLFGPKQCKSGKTIKIVVSAEIAQNQKWHLFFEKGVFLTWVKKWVLLCFWKAVLFWKHYFYSVFSKAQLFKSKNGMLKKNKKLWK